jgi:hypothetical protein
MFSFQIYNRSSIWQGMLKYKFKYYLPRKPYFTSSDNRLGKKKFVIDFRHTCFTVNVYISAENKVDSLTGQSNKLEEFVQADSADETKMIVYAWADFEADIKLSQMKLESFQEGHSAIKYCILTGCGVLLN